MPKLGLCSWSGSRVGLVEKHLLVNRDQTPGVGLWRWTEASLECDPPVLSPLLGYSAENGRTGDPSFEWPPRPVGIWAGIKLLCPGQKLGLWDP